jgi:hypothetical protein
MHSCELDGAKIDPAQRVRIVDNARRDHEFCSLVCAELWLESSQESPVEIYVTCEPMGQELSGSQAYFVRSQVVTHAPTRDRRHVFARRSDAAAHARMFRGRILVDDDKPFAKWLKENNAESDAGSQ